MTIELDSSLSILASLERMLLEIVRNIASSEAVARVTRLAGSCRSLGNQDRGGTGHGIIVLLPNLNFYFDLSPTLSRALCKGWRPQRWNHSDRLYLLSSSMCPLLAVDITSPPSSAIWLVSTSIA